MTDCQQLERTTELEGYDYDGRYARVGREEHAVGGAV